MTNILVITPCFQNFKPIDFTSCYTSPKYFFSIPGCLSSLYLPWLLHGAAHQQGLNDEVLHYPVDLSLCNFKIQGAIQIKEDRVDPSIYRV